jgi:hypothetical protein
MNTFRYEPLIVTPSLLTILTWRLKRATGSCRLIRVGDKDLTDDLEPIVVGFGQI